ncbi:MAG: protein translocase subunit SecF, partial [Patescibacteria group bacterium]
MVGLSLVSIFTYGLNLGIDFTGGSILEVSYVNNRPDIDTLKTALVDTEFKSAQVQPAGDK